MEPVSCPKHGGQLPAVRILCSQSPELVPTCCCSQCAYAAFYAFDEAWHSLPEADQIGRAARLTLALSGNLSWAPTRLISDFRETLLGLLSGGYCIEHGSDTSVKVELVAVDKHGVSFRVYGCCTTFVSASEFFLLTVLERRSDTYVLCA